MITTIPLAILYFIGQYYLDSNSKGFSEKIKKAVLWMVFIVVTYFVQRIVTEGSSDLILNLVQYVKENKLGSLALSIILIILLSAVNFVLIGFSIFIAPNKRLASFMFLCLTVIKVFLDSYYKPIGYNFPTTVYLMIIALLTVGIAFKKYMLYREKL